MKSKVVIGKYIRHLLTEGKRVILPGFGNLQIKEVSGEVPTSGGRINPPGPSVKFDAKYSKDDGLLASAYAGGEKIDPGEAEQQVLELVDAIRFALDKGEPYTLPGTGTFSRDEEGKIHFQTDSGWVLESDQFGLDSMDLLELEEIPEEPSGPGSEKSPGEAPQEEGPEEPVRAERPAVKHTPSWATPEPPVKRKRRASMWRIIWIIAGSLILVLLLLIFIPVDRTGEGGFRFGKEGIFLRKKSPEPMEEPAASRSDEQDEEGSVPGGGAEAAGEAGQEAAPAAEEPVSPGEETRETAGSQHYFIIAGSFRHLSNASEMQDHLKGMGYSSEVMITDNRMYRVSVASYATKEEALRSLKDIKAEEPELQNCWLLSN